MNNDLLDEKKNATDLHLLTVSHIRVFRHPLTSREKALNKQILSVCFLRFCLALDNISSPYEAEHFQTI